MKLQIKYFLLLIALILAALACNLPILGQNSAQEGGIQANTGQGTDVQTNDGQLPDGLTENYVPATSTFTNPFSYSADQQATLEAHGNPTCFTIIFTEANRQETWVYDTSGYTVVFRDGVKIAEKTGTTQYQEEMYATTLAPNQFYLGMGVDEVVLSTGRSNITFVTLKGLDKDTRLMYLEGLSIGLVDGKVNFVETIPSTTEIPLSQTDFTPSNQSSNQSPYNTRGSALTLEEDANLGLHIYHVVVTAEGETYEEDMAVEVSFFDGGCEITLVENSDTGAFTQIATNQYKLSEADYLLLTFETNGFSWQDNSDGTLMIFTLQE